MATVIRMKRGGRSHKPYYRVVVMDSRSRSRGPELDSLGTYHPVARPEPVCEVDVHKALDWLRKGAQCSDTARGVLSRLGVLKHFADGTTPEDAAALHKGTAVEDKGYNAPPPPTEKPKAQPEATEASEAEAESGDAQE